MVGFFTSNFETTIFQIRFCQGQKLDDKDIFSYSRINNTAEMAHKTMEVALITSFMAFAGLMLWRAKYS